MNGIQSCYATILQNSYDKRGAKESTYASVYRALSVCFLRWPASDGKVSHYLSVFVLFFHDALLMISPFSRRWRRNFSSGPFTRILFVARWGSMFGVVCYGLGLFVATTLSSVSCSILRRRRRTVALLRRQFTRYSCTYIHISPVVRRHISGDGS